MYCATAAAVQKARAPEKNRARTDCEHPGGTLGQPLDVREEFGRKLQPLGRRARKEKKSFGIRLFDGFDGDGNALRALIN